MTILMIISFKKQFFIDEDFRTYKIANLCNNSGVVAVIVESLDGVKKHQDELQHLHPRQVSEQTRRFKTIWINEVYTFSTRDICGGRAHRLPGGSKDTSQCGHQRSGRRRTHPDHLQQTWRYKVSRS